MFTFLKRLLSKKKKVWNELLTDKQLRECSATIFVGKIERKYTEPELEWLKQNHYVYKDGFVHWKNTGWDE